MKFKLLVDKNIACKEVELLKKPVIIRVNKFDDESAKEFSKDISKAHNTGQHFIPVVIDSYGGSVYSVLSMISEIQHSHVPIATVIEGKAMSAGAILFMMGHPEHRYISEHATLMIHEVSSWTGGKVEEIKCSANEVDRLNKLIFTITARHLGKKDDYFLKIIHEKKHAEWFIPAKEAKKLGLANHIGVPTFTTNVSVEHSFELDR